MTLNKQAMRTLYRRRAARYDLAVRIYPFFGFRMERYRRLAVDALRLRPGDTVIELGCGTGLNFPLLRHAVGAEGRVIGVDLTDAMLDQARNRVRRSDWQNVDLVQADASTYDFPAGVAGVFSTFAITLVPEYDEVIRAASHALKQGGRLAVFDFKQPGHWPESLVRFATWLNKPFGVSLDLAERHPWESIGRYLTPVHFQEFYRGALYLAVGER
ncbi:MAG TPA: methyltransferase domain-containing protein [Candidatus Methylomirabilis sp.]|nr:methyltransferase domain-containing protein [Candidatus Methylomirabilis sp.]